MGIFGGSKQSGPSPEDIAREKRLEREARLNALRDSRRRVDSKRTGRSDLKANPGLFIPEN